MKMKKYILSIIVFTAALFAGLPVFAEGSKDLYPNGASGGRAYLRASNEASLAFPFPNLGTHFVYAEAGEMIALASNAQSGTNKRIYLYNPSGVDVTPTISSGDGNISNRAAELAGPRLPNQTSGNQQNRYTPIYYTVPAGGSGIYKVEFRGTNNNTTGDVRLPYSAAASWPSIGNNTYNYLIAWDISVAKQTGSNWAWVPGRVYTNVLNMDNPSYGGNNGNDNNNFRPSSGFYGKFKVLTRDGYIYNVDNNGSQGISFTFMVNNRGFHIEGDPNIPSYKSIAAPTAAAAQNRYHDPNTADAEAAVTHKIFYNLPDNNMPIEATGGRPKAGETKTWLRPKQQNLNVTEMTLEGVDGTSSQISNKGGYIKFENNSGGDYTILIAPNINNPDYVATMNFVPRTLTGTSVPGVNNIYFDGKAGDGNMLPQGVIPVEITIKLRGAEVHFPYIDMELNHGGIIIELLKEDYSEVVSDKVYWDDSDIRLIDTSIHGSMTNPRNASHTAIPAGTSSNTNGHIWGTGSIRTSGTFGDGQGMDTWTFVEGDSHTQGFGVSHRIADLYVESVDIIDMPSDGSIRIGDEVTYQVIAGNKEGSCPVKGALFSFILPPGFVYEGDLSDISFSTPEGDDCGSQSGLRYDSATGTFHSVLDLDGECDATGGDCKVTYTFKVKVTDQATSANTTATATIMRPADVTDPDATNISDPAKTEFTGTVTGDTELDPEYYYHPTDPFFEVNNNGIENNVSNNIKDNQIPNFIDDIRADNDINQTPVDVPVNGNVLTNDYTSFGTLSVKSAEYYNNSGTLTALSLDSETTIYTPEGVEAGKITLKADESYIFTPATGFVGSVPVYYTAQNGTNSDDAKLTIKVIPEYDDNDLSNNKPVAHPDAVSTSKNTLITIDPRGNDNNPDGGALTVTEITYNGMPISVSSGSPTTIPNVGTAYKDGNNLVFTPDPNYIGEVPSFGYTIKNDKNATDSSTITITVTETASTAIIVANDDTNSAPIGIAMAGSVKANDNWGDPLKNPKITEASVTIGGTTTVLTVGSPTTIPGAGTITLNPDGSYTYTSTVIGTIPVVYTVKNDDGNKAKATLYLTALNDCKDLVLFFEDFGVSNKDDGNFGRKTSPYMPSGSFAFGTPYPQSTIYDKYEIDNNHYAVVAPGYIKLGVDPNYYYFWTPAYNETGAVTDRSGTENGAVMVVNAGSTLDAFYQRKISVVSGESYRASFWLYLVNGPSQVSIDIMNPATKEVLAVMTSPEMGDWDTTYKGKWTKFELYFKIPANLECEIDELLLSFRNNKSENQGNDYYVDDIKLEQVCEVPDGTPTVDVTCPTYAVSIEAIDDFYEVGNNSSVDGNVLDNDISEEGDVLTVTKVIVNGVETTVNPSGTTSFATSEGGTVVIQPDGSFTYTPPADKNGIFDKFDYIVCNQNNICDDAEVILAVGICYEEVGGKSFKWDYSDGSGVATETINQPVADYGFTFDIYELDNSFNMEINGVQLAVNEIEFQSEGTSGINIMFADGDKYETNTYKEDGTTKADIWEMRGNAANPLIRVVISHTGKVTMYGSKVSYGPLFPLKFIEDMGNEFNTIDFSNVGSENNVIKVTQNRVGVTIMDGYGYGRNRVDCPNYWYGYNDSEWAKNSNWTDNYVPEAYEDIVFATEDNNRGIIQGMSGPGAGKGAADKDLYLDNVNHNFEGTTTPSGGRIIGDLINKSEKDLVVTTTNQLIIDGKVHDGNTGIIVVKADKDDATGTLIFNKPNDNQNVAAKVEFINLADECADCGFYRRNWQYFGVPVQGGAFPFHGDIDGETVRRWDEPTNGDKWLQIDASHNMIPFMGYEITSKVTAPKYEFEGTLNVGDKEIELSKTPGVNYSGMNLLANSYTAAIPISSLSITGTNGSLVNDTELADQAVYLFNRGTRDQWRKTNGGTVTGIAGGQYTAVPINLAGQPTLPDIILSMHSFMVNAASDKAQITLKYDELVKNETGTNQPAWRSADNNGKRELPYIVLDVIGEGSADRVWLFEESSTTRGYDNGWDGHKMLEGDLIQVYATDVDQNKYQVTTVPQLDNITLGIAARENESYTISVATAADVEVRRLYLHDTFTGRGYLLKNGAEFVVSGTRSANQNRFKITSSPIAEVQKGDDASIINTYVRDNVIVVENRSNENATVSVYDISGRFVGKAQIGKDEVKSFVEFSINSGVKVVKVVSNSGSINRSDRVLLK